MPGVYINGQPVTEEQWQSGYFLDALLGNPQGTWQSQQTVPLPYDPQAAFAQAQAGFNRGLADSEASYRQGETAWGLGYNADGSLNTANPYSQAQLLQDSYRRSVTGTHNSMAAQGQLYSGARNNAQARNDRVYAEGSSALRDRARQTYHGIGYGQLSSYGQNAAGLGAEEWERRRRAVYGS